MVQYLSVTSALTVREKLSVLFIKLDMLKEVERDFVQEFHLPRYNFAATLYIDLETPKDNSRETGVTYLTHKKGYVVFS